jgi:ribonuclease E
MIDAMQTMEQASRGYSGPTPADPFGGTSDALMDAMEAAEAAAGEALAPRRQEPVVGAVTPASQEPETPKVAVTTEEAVGGGAPAPEASQAAAPEAAAPVAEAAEEAPETAAPEAPAAAAAPPKAEVQVGPAILPKSVEEIAAEAPRRGGWWKR